MIEGVTSDGVSIIFDALENVRVFLYIFTHTKESRFCVIFFQLLQYPGRHLRHGTVIKSDVQNFLIRGNFPRKIGK